MSRTRRRPGASASTSPGRGSETFDEATTPRTRKVALRSAMTMSPDAGGIFDTLLSLVRRGLGGRAGDGRQFISWIHRRGLRACDSLADRARRRRRRRQPGVAESAAERGVHADAARRVRRERSVCRPPAGCSRSARCSCGTETELILKSRRVVPARLLERGFRFRFPLWQDAARDLFQRWQFGELVIS